MAEDVDICDQQSAATSCLGWVAVLALSFITFRAFVTALPLVITFLMYKWHKSKTARESAKGVNDSKALLPTSVQEAESYGLSDCEDQEHNNLSEEDAANNQSAPQQIHDKPMDHNSAGESSGLWTMASSLSQATGGQSGSVSVLADPAVSCGGEPHQREATRTCQRQESSNGDVSDESSDSGVFYTAPSYIIETPEYTRAMLHQTHVEEEWQDLHSPTKMWGQQESLSQEDQQRGVPRSPDETEQNSLDTFHQHHQADITTKYVSNPTDALSQSVQKLEMRVSGIHASEELSDVKVKTQNDVESEMHGSRSLDTCSLFSMMMSLEKRIESLEKKSAVQAEDRIALHDRLENSDKKELDVDVERFLDDEIPQKSSEFRELKQSMARLPRVSRKDIDGCEHASDVLKILHKRGHTEEGRDYMYEQLLKILEKAQLIKVKRCVEKLVRNYSPRQHVHAAAVTEPAPVVLHTCQSVRPVTVVKEIAVDLGKIVPASASREPRRKRRKQDSPNREDPDMVGDG